MVALDNLVIIGLLIICLINFIYMVRQRRKIQSMELKINQIEHQQGAFRQQNGFFEQSYTRNQEKENHMLRDQEIVDLLRHGNTIEAIKKTRELYGFGLKEAKEYVETLRIPLQEGIQNNRQSNSDQDREILDLVKQGNKIEAIKRTREFYGFGLKEAKEYVEKLERNRF